MRLSLSPRETEVISLYAQGVSGPQIGKRLDISTGTVSTYLARIRTKFAARNRVHAAVLWATRMQK